MARKGSNLRKIDELGRISIPIEIRRELGWEHRDELTVKVDEAGNVILSKPSPTQNALYLLRMAKAFINQDELYRKDQVLSDHLDTIINTIEGGDTK